MGIVPIVKDEAVQGERESSAIAMVVAQLTVLTAEGRHRTVDGFAA